MTNGPQRTVLAQEAFKFNDVFGFKFQVLSFGTSVKRRLKLSPPEMSTDGGRKARQPLTLVPEEEGGRTIVVGWVDVPRKLAELRSFNTASQQFEERYKSSIDINREEWERAIAELSGFFRIQQIETTVVDTGGSRSPAKSKQKEEAEEKRGDPSIPLAITMLVIGILIGFGLGYLVFKLHILSG